MTTFGVIAQVDGLSTVLQYLVGAVLLSVIPAIFIISWLQRKKRTSLLEQFALLNDFEFADELPTKTEEDDEPGILDPGIFVLPILAESRDLRISNILRKKIGENGLYVFDSTCYGKPGLASSTKSEYYHTVVALNAERLNLSEFKLEPIFIIHRMVSFIWSPGVQIQGHPRFSRKYRIIAKDNEEVVRLFDDDILDYFGNNSNWKVEGKGQWLAVYREDRRTFPVKPKKYMDYIQDAQEIFGLFL